MLKVKNISIKSVLHSLSLQIPESEWDDYKFNEWALSAARQVRVQANFDEKVELIAVQDHSFNLPSDLVYLSQIIVYRGDIPNNIDSDKLQSYLDLPEGFDFNNFKTIKSNLWKPMIASETPFGAAIKCPTNLFREITTADECDIIYHVNQDMSVYTTLKEGVVLVAYLSYARDENGDYLIPDIEEFKEAIVYYCLMQYWTSRMIHNAPNALNMVNYFRNLWVLYKAKAQATANEPDLATYENIRRERMKIKPRDNFKNMFGSSNQQE